MGPTCKSYCRYRRVLEVLNRSIFLSAKYAHTILACTIRGLGPPRILLRPDGPVLGPDGLGWPMGNGPNIMRRDPHHECYNYFVGTMCMAPW